MKVARSARMHCAFCLSGTKEQCACWDGKESLTDSTACSFMVSGDVMCEGVCQAGTCHYTGTPGWAGCP